MVEGGAEGTADYLDSLLRQQNIPADIYLEVVGMTLSEPSETWMN